MKVFLILFFIIQIALACPEKLDSEKTISCNSNYSYDILKDQLDELLAMEYFKILENINISLKEMDSNSYYLATGILDKLNPPKERRYIIKINNKLFDCAPTERAMKAILAHELVHILDYIEGSRFNLLSFGARYVISGAKIERATDYRVFQLGLAVGIKEYRQWVYQLLSPKDLKVKRKRYYTPEEIDKLIILNPDFAKPI